LSLSLFAAESVVDAYLNGRVLPNTLHRAAVSVVKTRLVNGDLPVLDEFVRRSIDNHAVEASADHGALLPTC
jgi:hypothetical protein